MIIEVPGKVGRNDMLHNLAKYAGERYWPIISWVTFVSLVEKWTYPRFGPITWKYSCESDLSKTDTLCVLFRVVTPSRLLALFHQIPQLCLVLGLTII